ncbi:OmpA family protein [Deltaproteobacteria bacterium TL4]
MKSFPLVLVSLLVMLSFSAQLMAQGISQSDYDEKVKESNKNKNLASIRQKTINTLNSKIAALETEVKNAKTLLEEKEAQYQKVIAEKDNLDKELGLLKQSQLEMLARSEELKVLLDTATTEKEALQNSHTEKITQLEGEISKNADQLKALEEQLVLAKEGEAQRLAQKEELEQQVKALIQQLEETQAPINMAYAHLATSLKKEIEAQQIRLISQNGRLLIRVQENLLFSKAEAFIQSKGFKILGQIGKSLKPLENVSFQVVGHTDNVKISRKNAKRYKNNWELSTARAISVLKYLVEDQGFEPSRISAVGQGEYQPVASNKTSLGRQNNRRIEFVLLAKR